MASLGEIYAALPEFRAVLHEERFAAGSYDTGAMTALNAAAPGAGGQLPAFTSPLGNIHATGVGVRVRGGKVIPNEFVLKVYVFSKLDLGAQTPKITQKFKDLDVDVEHLPVQLALARDARPAQRGGRVTRKAAGIPRNRQKQRPIVGGVSIAPLDAQFVGTLGCFVQRRVAGVNQMFALSNNHVLADVNRLPAGTQIVQPGAETGPTTPADVFAQLTEFIPIRFSSERLNRVVNRFDAAIARVTDERSIKTGSILDIARFTPQLSAPQPGMRVIKSGRTTGVTRGTITGVGVNGVQVNYGTQTNPIIATFDDTVQIVSESGPPFSAPGDSGSVILDEASGKPVALLFAGDGRTTTACNFAGVCRHFNVMPA